LNDRLQALQQQPRLPSRLQTTAAETFLKDVLAVVERTFDQEWADEIGPSWRQRHAFVRGARGRLRDLELRGQLTSLSLTEAWERATLAERFRSSEAAAHRYYEVLKLDPQHPQAQFRVGLLLLRERRAVGIEQVEAAIERNPALTERGCEAIAAFLRESGRGGEAARYERRAAERARRVALARDERRSLTPQDHYLPHGLPEAPLAILRDQLPAFPNVRACYLVRKDVLHLAEEPLYVLAVRFRRTWMPRSVDAERALLLAMSRGLTVPGETIVVSYGRDRALRRALSAISDARFYTAA
jgi:hypothetical protein